jgi:putative hydrolase of the HAD superfamily
LIRAESRRRGAAAGQGKPLVWFFDLDNTLHDASHAVFPAIDSRMTEYVQRHLQLDRDAADRLRRTYWERYGATLLGLMRHHGVDPGRFLRETHDFDVAALLRAERGLEHLGRRLAGRKVLLSNAPMDYAGRVLRELGLHRHIGKRYAVEHMRVHGHYRPKPALSMLRAMLIREKLAGRSPGARAVLVDDSAANLKAARAAGYATVLVTRRVAGAPRRLAGGSYVMARIRSVKQLPARGQNDPKPYMTVTAPNGNPVGILPGVAEVRRAGFGPVQDFAVSPTPGIETIAPTTVLQGSPETTVTLTGVNFVKRSVVFVNGEPVQTMVDSTTKLRFVLPPGKFADAGKLHVLVKNPQPLINYRWGDTSNMAHILVPYAFSTELARPANLATE